MPPSVRRPWPAGAPGGMAGKLLWPNREEFLKVTRRDRREASPASDRSVPIDADARSDRSGRTDALPHSLAIPPVVLSPLAWVGRRTLAAVADLGRMATLLGLSARSLVRPTGPAPPF